MSNRITKSLVEAAVPAPGRDIWLWDGEAKGFGLRVRPSGRKVYIVEYRPGSWWALCSKTPPHDWCPWLAVDPGYGKK